MAAPNVDNVTVAITGGARYSPVGTTAPTTPTAAYAAGWLEMGYISEDGITESGNVETTEIKAWQNGTTVRKVISAYDLVFKLTVITKDKDIWALWYPGSTIATAAGVTTTTVKAPTSDPKAFGFDVVDGAKHERILVPKGEVTSRGDIVYKSDEPIGFELEITAYRASDGTVAIKLTDDAAMAVS